MTGPTLATARLKLAPHKPEDFEEMAAMNTDPAFTAQIGLPPATREDAWHRLLRYVAHWQVMGFGHWVVRETVTGEYLGDVGLMEARRATEPSFEGTPEAAWGFRPRVHGRGYAREAVTAMLGWADAQGVECAVAIIGRSNAPSIRLAERVGFRAAGEVAYKDEKLRLFERFAPS